MREGGRAASAGVLTVRAHVGLTILAAFDGDLSPIRAYVNVQNG
jgi:hypothetical protein